MMGLALASLTSAMQLEAELDLTWPADSCCRLYIDHKFGGL